MGLEFIYFSCVCCSAVSWRLFVIPHARTLRSTFQFGALRSLVCSIPLVRVRTARTSLRATIRVLGCWEHTISSFLALVALQRYLSVTIRIHTHVLHFNTASLSPTYHRLARKWWYLKGQIGNKRFLLYLLFLFAAISLEHYIYCEHSSDLFIWRWQKAQR